jgi:hypothetical protein
LLKENIEVSQQGQGLRSSNENDSCFSTAGIFLLGAEAANGDDHRYGKYGSELSLHTPSGS